MTLITSTVTADTTGNIYLPADMALPAPGSPVTILAAGAVSLQGSAGTSAPGFTLPANVPLPINLGGQKMYLKTSAGTVAVSYTFVTS